MRLFSLGLLAAVTLAAVGIGGCKGAQTLGGKPRPKLYRTIVSLSPSTTEIAASNGINLAGRTAADDYPPSITKLPVVASVKPDYEALARMKPDLILYDKELYSGADVEKLKSLGAETFEWDPNTLDEYRKRLFELGSLGAAETMISSYVDRVDREVQTAEGDPPQPRPTVAVILPGPNGRHMVMGTKGLRAEIVKVSGGEPIGPDSNLFEPLSPEFLVAKDPDVIVLAIENPPATPPPAGTPPAPSAARAEFEGDARFAGLKALRRDAEGRNHVYGLPSDVLLRRGSRVNLLIDNLHKAFKLATQSERAPK